MEQERTFEGSGIIPELIRQFELPESERPLLELLISKTVLSKKNNTIDYSPVVLSSLSSTIYHSQAAEGVRATFSLLNNTQIICRITAACFVRPAQNDSKERIIRKITIKP
jgi:hypothetical protein